MDPTQYELPGTHSERELARSQKQQEAERKLAEKRLRDARAELIALARTAATHLANRNGTVTSPQVVKELRRRGYGPLLDKVDRRLMGPVFRGGFRRVGYANEGSHGAAVSVWELKDRG